MPSTADPIELLAPARDARIACAALDHGADAVYLGGPGFGARAAAGNAVADIARVVAHAQRFRARVFVTLNTLLHDHELEPARRLAWQLWDAGVDALIVQDMGLLLLDLPPLALHASTQCDIRSPEKARFLQDVGFTQLVLARELDLGQIAAIRAATDPACCTLEHFVHGALCVAYSGQCNISMAHTGRSANRGECNQACRLPYQVIDAAGRYVAHDRHVLSMKDNDQSANLAELLDAGVRSFKIEGRYKDLAYVKNITGHYRQRLDALIDARAGGPTALRAASSGRTRLHFSPDPAQNFNRAHTDYFTHGRRDDIGAFDSPKNPGQPLGHVLSRSAESLDLALDAPDATLHNGDGLCYFDAQQVLQGLAVNRCEALNSPTRPADPPSGAVWRVWPRDGLAEHPDLRKGRSVNRNRDAAWLRALDKPSSTRRIGLRLVLDSSTDDLCLRLTDADGVSVQVSQAWPRAQRQRASDAAAARAHVLALLSRLGATDFEATYAYWTGDVADFVPQLADAAQVSADAPADAPAPAAPNAAAVEAVWAIAASALNALRRAGVAALVAQRAATRPRTLRRAALQPFVPYPQSQLDYLANVLNAQAFAFYRRHGVEVIEPAFEALQQTGEVSLMVTKHCVRFSLSLCPKQAKGVTGVQGCVRADPLRLVNGREQLTLRFDCKACEMHVLGRIKPGVLAREQRSRAQAGWVGINWMNRPKPVVSDAAKK